MKKYLMLFAFIGGLIHVSIAQENNLKNFRFGLKATPTFNWYKPDNQKKFENGGTLLGFDFGLMTEFRLNDVAVLATGIDISKSGGKLTFLDSTYYYLDSDDEFVDFTDTAATVGASNHLLRSRAYKRNYVQVPFTLKMKTKEIGMMTYFGQFGVNLGFNTKTRVDDTQQTKTALDSFDSESEKSDLNLTDEAFPVNVMLNIGGGAEYNLSGSTSIVFGLNYYNGFMNVFSKNSTFLYRQDGTVQENFSQKAFSRAFALSVGILF